MPLLLLAGLAVSGFVACSLVVNRDSKQCANDADCERIAPGSGATCDLARGVCVPLPVGFPGCVPAGPDLTSEQLLNACTEASWVLFDNAGHGLEDGDGAPLNPPTGATPVSPPPATGTADAGTTQFPPCYSPADGRDKVIYMTGSSNFPPLLAKLGPFIIRASNGFTPVYLVTSSCNGVKSVFSTVASERMIADPANARGARATYVTADGLLVACSLPAGGVQVDVGESDIASSSCGDSVEQPLDVGEYLGPIQAMIFAVPNTSQQEVISAEMARAVFGRGGGNAMPWIDPRSYFVRNANTGTQQLIGRAIHVDADKFWGTDYGTATNLKNQIQGVTVDRAQQSIGIISSDYYDPSANSFKELAFQAFGQVRGFWPDSSQYVGDKRNVRDGHYPIWGPLHFFTHINPAGSSSTAAATAFVSNVSIAEPDKEVLNAFIDASLVPSCAMRVQRGKTDLGPLSPVTPPLSCGCYFDTRVAKGVVPAQCKACSDSIECPASRPACRLDYCEPS
jgi:hypothetical protein